MTTKKPPSYGIQGLVQRRALERAGSNACPIDSSAIAEAGYDEGSQRLVLTFHSGRSYAYYGVSAQRYRAFCNAGSKGRYFNYLIRDVYPYRRLG